MCGRFNKTQGKVSHLMDPVGAQAAQRLHLAFEPDLAVNSQRRQWSPKKHERPGTVSRPERSGTFRDRHHQQVPFLSALLPHP